MHLGRSVILAALAGSAIAALGGATGALAQSSEPILEEIIVYGERRARQESETPISLTAFSEKDINDRGIDRFEDFVRAIPNFTMTAGVALRQTRINIRGVATDPANIGLDPSVPVYVDGIAQGRHLVVNSALYDLESIEVLRGPQGTLFGRNSIAGAVLLRTRRPSTEGFETSGKLTFGEESLYQVSGLVNIPLGANAAFKVGAAKREHDGFDFNQTLDKEVNNLDSTSVRAQLLLTPNENLEMIARFEWSDDEIDGNSPDFAPVWDSSAGFDRIVEQNFDDFTDRETKAGSLEINYDFGNGYTLTSLTGLQTYDSSNWRDIDMTPLDILQTTSGPDSQDQFSQELRIASPVMERFDWIAGVYYFEQEADTTFTASIGSLLTGGPPTPFFLVGLGESKTEAWSAYGHLNYRLSEQLTATLGLRYTSEDKDGLLDQSPVPSFGIPEAYLQDSASDNEPSVIARLSYRPNDNWLVYGSFSTGYKASGYNIQPSAPEGFKADPEFLDSWEVGAKAEYNNVRFSASAFINDYTDLQVSRFESPPGGGLPVQIFGNAGKMDASGVELQLTWVPVENLSLGLAYGYLNAEYKEFSVATQDWTGNVPQRSPENTLAANAQYVLTNLAAVDVRLRVDYFYKDEWFGTDTNDPMRHQPPVDLLNARVAIEDKDGRWSLAFWGKNLTDELHASQFSPPLGVPGIGRLWALPRHFGADLTWNF